MNSVPSDDVVITGTAHEHVITAITDDKVIVVIADEQVDRLVTDQEIPAETAEGVLEGEQAEIEAPVDTGGTPGDEIGGDRVGPERVVDRIHTFTGIDDTGKVLTIV